MASTKEPRGKAEWIFAAAAEFGRHGITDADNFAAEVFADAVRDQGSEAAVLERVDPVDAVLDELTGWDDD